MPRNAASRKTAGYKRTGDITFTTVAARVLYAEALPRFVRATQILMLGAERRRAAEAQASGSEAAK